MPIIYLHGFNSSPESFKARLLGERMRERGAGADFFAPKLPHLPRAAIALAEQTMSGHDPARVTLVGSSLGGYYATWLAERHGCRAVLLNPAVHAHELLSGMLGSQVNLYSGERYELTPEHIAQLRALDVDSISAPQRYLLIVTTGDEVLDYRAAVAKYAGARRIVVPGGDHGFGTFGAYADAVLEFAATV
ncbi:MAG TPA: YqiA/YcfP family alpha/beta fold hydrolase [Burkholderiales bacterium]|nr:YqiA/YcfP family alpha/beta fold hydrolase [Burkholderiales bacterium]